VQCSFDFQNFQASVSSNFVFCKQLCANVSFRRVPGRLIPSNLAPVLQYSSGTSSDFLAKILDVDISMFLCKHTILFSTFFTAASYVS
jgi:hypothetical protein